jgi:hypothetical protein
MNGEKQNYTIRIINGQVVISTNLVILATSDEIKELVNMCANIVNRVAI